MKIKYIYIVLIFLLFSCREEFSIDNIEDEKIFTVDGLISNSSSIIFVKLSYSSLASMPQKNKVSGCNVKIEDIHGHVENLSEAEVGTYITQQEFIGIVGNKYRLLIETPDGKRYISDFQEMKKVVEIDKVYANTAYVQIAEVPHDLPGYQFYIDTKLATNNNSYLLWNMIETYEYDIDNEFEYVEYRFGEISYYNPYSSFQTCWKTNSVYSLYTGTTENLNTPVIKGKLLHFVGTDTKKLTIRYSVLVNQYSIDKKAYEYWKSVETQISDENFLSTTQPYNVVGNIKNVDDPSEKVLGYFTVASVSSKRIFINRPFVPFYYPVCGVITDAKSISNYKYRNRPPYFYTMTDLGIALSFESCFDCRNKGGDIYKPDFWIN